MEWIVNMESEIRFFRNTGHSLLSHYISSFLSIVSFFLEGKKKEREREEREREREEIVISFINVDPCYGIAFVILFRFLSFSSFILSFLLLSFFLILSLPYFSLSKSIANEVKDH